MTRAFVLFAIVLYIAAPASAQTAASLDNGPDSAASSYRYASDYEVGSWPVEDRVRPAPRDLNTLQTNDELLGGPVPQVDRHKVSGAKSAPKRVVISDTASKRANAAQAGDLPGRQLEDRFGAPLGRIAVIERDTAGNVSAAWVQPPHAHDAALRKIDVSSIVVRAGRVVAETR